MDNKKIGRNEQCPCGSGKKYKKYHGALPKSIIEPHQNAISDDEIKKQFEKIKALQLQKQSQQGMGREIISNLFKGYRFIAVGNRFYYSKKWNTFHDFLGEYIQLLFTKEWFRLESKKEPASRHPILRWIDFIRNYREKALKENKGDIISPPMTGAVFAYLSISYNLYLLAHNVEIQERLIKRLKNKNLFYGALYETIVASYFIKAGFHICLEDEYEGSSSHSEFVAVSRKTGNRYAIEVKTRTPEKQDFSIRNQLHKALKKETTGYRVIFIDLNTPHNYDPVEKRLLWLNEVISELRSCEESLTVHRKPAPEAYVFTTNYPYLYCLDSLSYAPAIVAEGFKIPDFKIDSKFSNLREALLSREKHIDMLDLMNAMKMVCPCF